MTLDPWLVATILAMAVTTFAIRAGGYLLFRSIPTPPLLQTALNYVPGALFVSYVVPALAAGGLQQWAGAAATLLLMALFRRVDVAILGGTATAWLVWSFG